MRRIRRRVLVECDHEVRLGGVAPAVRPGGQRALDAGEQLLEALIAVELERERP